MSGKEEIEALRSRLNLLEQQLEEANETLDAIRNGEVDAVVVGGAAGQIVYTLENADRPYRVLVEQMKEGAVTLAEDGAVLYCNRSFAQLVGGSSETIIGSPISDYFAERASLERLLGLGGGGRSAELSLRRADGRRVPVNLSVVELRGEEGAARMLSGIVTDLSENYERAMQLAKANQRLSAEITERGRAEQSLAVALDAADMRGWDLDLEPAEADRSSPAATSKSRLSAAPKWGLAEALKEFSPGDREAVGKDIQSAAGTGRVSLERRMRRQSDGAVRWVQVKGRSVEVGGGARRLTGIILDVTERRLIDEQLRQAQKMEAIGQLTGGIAHDFNNLLMIIGGSLQALSHRLVIGEREQRLLDAAQLGVARGAKLNEQLLTFARRQDMKVDTLCVDDLLPAFASLLDHAMGETVTVELRRQDGLWHCTTDLHQLEAAILNLAINARDAMPSGGALMLTTQNVVVSETEAAAWEARAGEYVSISIADTGSGMDADLLARVFEPFFTTKEIGKGTGLGLSQVYGFARQSGGFVTIDSAVGKGTTVSIHLPRGERRESDAGAPAKPRISHEASGTILLVEDDADVRAASGAMIEALGYSVRPAESGRAALDSLADDDSVDCVFSDVIMAAGMTAVELARCIKHRHPNLPILLTSGHTAQRLTPHENDDLPLLRKPFTMEELSEALRRAIEGDEPRLE